MQDKLQKRSIGLKTAIIVGMNAMIGAGIFNAPFVLCKTVGPVGVVTYIFVMLVVWMIGISLSRVAQLYPEEGSFYSYAKPWAGHFGGLIAAGSYILGLLIAIGLIAKTGGVYLNEYICNVDPVVGGGYIVIGSVIINLLGLGLSQAGQIILLCCAILPLLFVSIVSFFYADFSNFFPFAPYGFSNILQSSKSAIFGFFGFECAASLFIVLRDPKDTISKALTYSILLVGFLYILFITSIMLSVPKEILCIRQITISQIILLRFPDKIWAAKIINFSILSAIIGTVNSLLWSCSMLTYSLFRKIKINYFGNWLIINFGNYISNFLVLVISMISVTTLKTDEIFYAFTSFFIVLAYMASMITVLIKHYNQNVFYRNVTIAALFLSFIIFLFSLETIVVKLKMRTSNLTTRLK